MSGRAGTPSRQAGFTLRIECTRCGMPLPLERPTREATCHQCQSPVRIPAEVWTVGLAAFEGERRPPAGKVLTVNETVAGFRLHLQIAHTAPSCEKCGHFYELPDTDGDFACGHCGDQASVVPAPDWLRATVPTCARIVSTDPGLDSTAEGEALAPSITEEVRPVAMACPSCAGSLRITAEHERVVPCQYCGTDVFLPDEVWRRLHPVKTVQWWFAVFEGKTAAEQQRDQEKAEAARLRAEADARAERAFDAVRAAWAAAALFGLWVLVAAFMLLEGASAPGPGGSATNVVLLSGVLYLVAVALTARPLAIADGGSWGKRVIGYAAVGLIYAAPVVGMIFALLTAFVVFQRNPKDPASGVGRPLMAVYLFGAGLVLFSVFHLKG